MTTRQKHWLFFSITAIGAIVVVNLAILLMWTDMSDEERIFGKQIFGRVVTYGTLAMIVLFFISSQFILYIFRNYISPIEKLTEETRLITMANAKYRIKPVGAMETTHLTSVINELADSYISLKSDVKNIVSESKEGFEDEKLRLEALMKTVSEGVIICNHDGRILLCNHKAYDIFNSVEHDNELGRFTRLGLGISIFSVFNRPPMIYGFEHYQNLKNDEEGGIFNFITTRFKKQFLDVRISQIIKHKETKDISGYVILFKDITPDYTSTLDTYKNTYIILDEIASIVNMSTHNYFNVITESGIWFNFSEFPLTKVLIALAEILKTNGVKTISLGLSDDNKLQVNWGGSLTDLNFDAQEFREKISPPVAEGNHIRITIDVDVHKQESEWKIRDPRESRPVYYSHDMFDHEAQSKELDNKLLKDLTYVVFDTETTGLDPSGGDEIISIAGVRIFNGRVNNEETFDELVNPKRSIPLTSLKIHEIYPEMLKDKLTIDKILPQFHEFVGDAILIAHNAAFDMRFLQLKEEQTGVKFSNPVLDTLLLSAVCNPKQEVHNLEDIADKCGVEITGRHTALGDSIVTAEVFLKLIPLLENIGIKTLGQAREASQNVALSKIKF